MKLKKQKNTASLAEPRYDSLAHTSNHPRLVTPVARGLYVFCTLPSLVLRHAPELLADHAPAGLLERDPADEPVAESAPVPQLRNSRIQQLIGNVGELRCYSNTSREQS